MASTGTWNTATNTWSSDPQTEIDQAETPETALGSTNNLISTQQGPRGGTFIPPADYTQELSFTDATVSASTPSAANAGQGSVNLDYYHSAAFNSMDLYGQVYLHCNPNTSS